MAFSGRPRGPAHYSPRSAPAQPGPGSLGIARRDHEGHGRLKDMGGRDPRTAGNRRRNFVITAAGRWGGRAAAARPGTHGHGGGDVPPFHFGHGLLRGSSTSRWVKALGQTGGIGALDRLGRRADTRLCALRRCTVRPLRSPVPSLCGTSPDDAGSPLRGTLDTERTSGPAGPWINEAYLQPEASALPPARAWSRDETDWMRRGAASSYPSVSSRRRRQRVGARR